MGCGAQDILCGGPNVGGGNPCGTATVFQVGPLLSTAWAQACGGFNNLCDYDKCNGNILNCPNNCNSNPPVGCVATAIGQILKYWANPSIHNYNYASMPNYSGNIEVQRMMVDIGCSVDMKYKCSGSGTDADNIPISFTNTFGYSSSIWTGFSSSSIHTVVDNLDAFKPVIFDGCRTRTNKFLGIFYKYSDCHAWVCDGYQKYIDNCYSYLFFHMNWGWGEYGGNGWYAHNNWNSMLGTYQYVQNITYNINP